MDYKIGIVEWAFPFPGPAGFKTLNELGIEGIELDFSDYENGFVLTNERVQESYLEHSEKYNIEIPSIALNALNSYGITNDRNSAHGMIAYEVLKKGIETAAKMSIPVVQVPSFDDGAIEDDYDFYNASEKLRFACDLAEKHDITIAMENVLSAEKTLNMIETVGGNRLKVFYDTQNYHLDKGFSQVEILRNIASHVVQLHVKDGFNKTISSALLGKGDCSFSETLKLIKETNCTKWLFLENYYAVKPLSLLDDDPFKLISLDIETLHNMLKS